MDRILGFWLSELRAIEARKVDCLAWFYWFASYGLGVSGLVIDLGEREPSRTPAKEPDT